VVDKESIRDFRKYEVFLLALEMFQERAPAPGSGEVGRLIIESHEFTAVPEYQDGELIEWHRTDDTLSAHDVTVQVWRASEYLFGERI
jgi:hypothetical protein